MRDLCTTDAESNKSGEQIWRANTALRLMKKPLPTFAEIRAKYPRKGPWFAAQVRQLALYHTDALEQYPSERYLRLMYGLPL